MESSTPTTPSGYAARTSATSAHTPVAHTHTHSLTHTPRVPHSASATKPDAGASGYAHAQVEPDASASTAGRAGDAAASSDSAGLVSALSAYREWVCEHPTDARRVEEAVRIACLFLPGQLSDLAYSVSNALSVAHDMLLDPRSLPEAPDVSVARGALAVLGSVDVVMELLGAAVGGPRGRWTGITAVEAVRAALRIYLLAVTKERMLIHGGITPSFRGHTRTQDIAGHAAATPGRASGRDGVADSGGTGSSASASKPSSPAEVGRQAGAAEDTPTALDDRAANGMDWWRGSLSGITLPIAAKPDERPPPGTAAEASQRTPADAVAAIVSFFSLAMAAIRPLPSRTPSHESRAYISARLRAGAPEPAEEAVYPSASAVVGDEHTSSDSNEVAGHRCSDEARPLMAAAELLNVLRPLVYVVTRNATGGRSVLPGVFSIATDVLSARCLTVAQERAAGFAEPFIPEYFASAARNASVAAGTWVTETVQRIRRGDGTPAEHPTPQVAAAAASALHAAVADFTLPSPPGAGAENALFDALRSRDAGLTGVAIRFGLWMLSTPPGLTPAEEAELSRRKMLWMLYLLRSPFLRTVTMPAANLAVRAADWIPLLGTLFRYLRHLLVYFSSHYFYVSGSQ